MVVYYFVLAVDDDFSLSEEKLLMLLESQGDKESS